MNRNVVVVVVVVVVREAKVFVFDLDSHSEITIIESNMTIFVWESIFEVADAIVKIGLSFKPPNHRLNQVKLAQIRETRCSTKFNVFTLRANI